MIQTSFRKVRKAGCENSYLYQAVAEVDRNFYNKILKPKNFFVGYESYNVYNAVELYRDYK